MFRSGQFVPALFVALLAAGGSALAQAQHGHGDGAHVDVDVTLKLGIDRNYRSSNTQAVYTLEC